MALEPMYEQEFSLARAAGIHDADVGQMAMLFASEDDLHGAVADAVANLLGLDDGDSLSGG